MGKIITQHVVPNPDGGWSVRKGGSKKATKAFDRQNEAITYAQVVSKRQGAELFIHGRDGMIRDKRSYGDDPLPPKGKD